MSASFPVSRRFPSLVILLVALFPYVVLLGAALRLLTPTVAQAQTTAHVPQTVAQETGTDVKPAAAKAEVTPGAAAAVVALGESLFKDKRLSSTGSMSCASCHRLDRSFTEDKPQTIGQSGIGLGRNTPTLLGLASVDRFPVDRSFMRPPQMISLEERVLLPLHDDAEMDVSAKQAVTRLSADRAYAEAFEVAFAEAGVEAPAGDQATAVTEHRLASALAAYVRSLKSEEGPGRLALAGSNLQLAEPVSRGLEVFRDSGRCQSCHSGPGLTDGKLHVVALFRQQPISPRVGGGLPLTGPEVTKVNAGSVVVVGGNAAATETRPRMARSSRAGGYGQRSLERQTLPARGCRPDCALLP